ncbi:DUF2213 domain-containing protein [Rhizobium leguminosarum]|jgi:hypothetical protein|uniref:DUF2213 domain-containing protein n=1 Tax=Rhizobium leguminosarum TaxID=384 RepID=A0A444I3I5_RHILE|nr:DUF2213 domain-containing protein [Rhizobium leguminosarum]RWX32034.1 DUF2213 domain-containing protein [Rhizobium leguminosarum]
MQFTDKLTLDGAIRRTADGYGVVSAKVARGGNVQLYLGSEVGMNDKATVRVYRPESEVFKKDAIASYAGVPVTINHPKNGVSAETWKDLAVGEVGDDVLRDGEFVRVPMMLRDAKAIKAVEDGKRELSMGYSAEITFADGVTPSGETFDAIMSDFKMNHVAIVDQARGGAELRIGDGADKWGAAPISTTDKETVTMTDALRTVVVDGLSVQTTDQGAQAIAKLQKDLESSAAKILSSDAAHATAIAAKDEEIGTLKAENQKLKDAAPKPADLDKLVADRAALVTTIKAIDSKIEVSGVSDSDLRRAAVKAKLGDEMVKDASDAEITGMFKAIAKDVKTADPFATVVRDGLKQADTSNSNAAHAAMVSDMSTAWMGNQSKGAA